MFLRGIVWYFYVSLFNTASSAAPSDSTVSEDVWIEPSKPSLSPPESMVHIIEVVYHPETLRNIHNSVFSSWFSFNVNFGIEGLEKRRVKYWNIDFWWYKIYLTFLSAHFVFKELFFFLQSIWN